ncbi:hypothetical protein PBRA_009318 [Plasmodiophora brassicae]|uniref:G-protein coupled receptors family 3 profile domain-containing protein n=1 Tax=Plasmodiophora brassicae TaxID=37360 RepID=A0A0G4J6D3_PLABS|nr:hypothetical protein PBRA_009318 [Plasmodiophora brassicae]
MKSARGRTAAAAVLAFVVLCYGGRAACFNRSALVNAVGENAGRDRGADLRPIVIEILDWDSIRGASAVGKILFEEVLGYRAIYSPDSPLASQMQQFQYVDCGKGLVDVDFENWPQSGLCQESGAIGYNGYDAVSIPSYLLTQYPSLNLNLGVMYRQAATTNLFIRSGTLPEDRMAERPFVPPWCASETSPPNCQDQLNQAAYFAYQCNVTKYSNSCIELYDYSSAWDPDMRQSLITNWHLNITIVYLGDGYSSYIQALYDSRAAFLLMDPVPSVTDAKNSFTRVYFKDFSRLCLKAIDGSRLDGSATTFDCDAPVQYLMKATGPSFRAEPRFQDAMVLFRQFILTLDDINVMISGPTDLDGLHETACRWLHDNVNTWRSWVSITPAPVAPTYVSFSAGARTACFVASAFGAAISLGMMGAVLYFRHRPAMKTGSIPFTCMISGLSAVTIASAVMFVMEPSPALCSARIVVFATVITFALSCILAKNLRIYRIFTTSAALPNTKQHASNRRVLLNALTATLPATAIAILHVAIAPPAVVAVQVASSSASQPLMANVCASGSWYDVVLYVYVAVLVVAGVRLSILAWNVPDSFNEGRFLAIGLYVIAFTAVIVIPVATLLTTQPTAALMVTYGGIVLATITSQIVITAPKLLAGFRNERVTTNASQTGAPDEFQTKVAGTTSSSRTGKSVDRDAEIAQVQRTIDALTKRLAELRAPAWIAVQPR